MTTSNILFASLDESRIAVKSNLKSSKRILEATAALLTKGLAEGTKEKDIYHLLLEREKIGNTGVGDGVAIPHSRCAFTEQAVVAIILLETPVDYDSLDRQPVDVVFGLLVPQEATQEHLNLLAEIARLMSNPRHKSALASAQTPTQAMNLIGNWVKNTTIHHST